MIKDNQTLLNRIHVVVDALVIACTYIATWFIQFEFFRTGCCRKTSA